MDDVRGNPSLFEQVHKDVTRRCPQESAHDLQAAPRSPHTTPRAHHRQRHAGSWDIIPTAATHVAQPSSPDQAAETATAPQHVKAWDVRVAWRDAELFHMSRREGRLVCALAFSHWQNRVMLEGAKSLRLKRFSHRKRHSQYKSHLLSWWAAVLLNRPSPISDDYDSAEDSANKQTVVAWPQVAERVDMTAMQNMGSARKGADAWQHQAQAIEDSACCGHLAEHINQLKKKLADATDKTSKLDHAESVMVHAIPTLAHCASSEATECPITTVRKAAQEHAEILKADFAVFSQRAIVPEQRTRRAESEVAILKIKERARQRQEDIGRGKESTATTGNVRARQENDDELTSVHEAHELRRTLKDAAEKVAELVVLISLNDRDAEASFLEHCLVSSNACGSQTVREGGGTNINEINAGADLPETLNTVQRSLNFSRGSPIDVVTALNELAALMLLRYRFLEAEKHQTVETLEHQLRAALEQLDTMRQELSVSYENLEQLVMCSGQALANEELERKRLMEENQTAATEVQNLKTQVRQLRAEKIRQGSGQEGNAWRQEREEMKKAAELHKEESHRERNILQIQVRTLRDRCMHLELRLAQYSSGLRGGEVEVANEQSKSEAGIDPGNQDRMTGYKTNADSKQNWSKPQDGKGGDGKNVLTPCAVAQYCSGETSVSSEGVGGREGRAGNCIGHESQSSTDDESDAIRRDGGGTRSEHVSAVIVSALNANRKMSEKSATRCTGSQVRERVRELSPGDDCPDSLSLSLRRLRQASISSPQSSPRLSNWCLQQVSPQISRPGARRCMSPVPDNRAKSKRGPPSKEMGRALDHACMHLQTLEAQLLAISSHAC